MDPRSILSILFILLFLLSDDFGITDNTIYTRPIIMTPPPFFLSPTSVLFIVLPCVWGPYMACGGNLNWHNLQTPITDSTLAVFLCVRGRQMLVKKNYTSSAKIALKGKTWKKTFYYTRFLCFDYMPPF
jgi:hypothetical protein